MNILINILLNGLAIFIASYILPGVRVNSFLTALIVATVLALINMLIKPILIFLTLPITIVTFGLFLLVINGLLILLASRLVSGFSVSNIWWAILLSIVVSVIYWVLSQIVRL